MIDSTALRALVDEWRTPVRKGRLFGKKWNDSARLEAARRLAELSSDATVDSDLVEALERAACAFSEDRGIRRAYARALAEAGRIGEAIAEFEERLESKPDDAEDLVDVAALYAHADRNDLAVDRLHRAVDVYVASQDLDAAVRAARRLIDIEPQSLESASDLVSMLRTRDPALLAEGIEHLADVYRDRGKLGQEASACRELLALEPDRSDVQERLSSIYARILEVDPDDQDAWIGLATIDEGLADRLRMLFVREDFAPVTPALGGSPAAEDQKAYASRKARELMDAGDVVGASLCLERVVRTNPDPTNHLRLARCYLALHREWEAAREGLRAIALAQTLDDQATVDEALEWLGGLAPEGRDPLADAVFLNHRPESADILYEALLQVWDESAGAARGVGATAKRE